MANKRKTKKNIAKKGAARKQNPYRFVLYIIPILLLLSMIFLTLGYAEGKIPETMANSLLTVALSMLFSTSVIAYLTSKGMSLSDISKSLKIDVFHPKGSIISWAIILFVVVIILELALGLFQVLTGVSLPTNVATVLGTMPVYVLAFSVLIAPINEEILFRGFLVPRVGIVLSALIFAIPHLLAYSSIAELIGAFAFGLAAGYVYKKTGSLWPSIIAHALVNLIAVLPFLKL